MVLALLVVTLTTLSMSAIATNGEVRGGGCYYLISRSLGAEFGGSIGVILYVANTLNAAMNCVGLAETIVAVLDDAYGVGLIDAAINDVRLYGALIAVVLQAIICVGAELENRTQLALMLVVVVALLSHCVGTALPTSAAQRTRGIVGYSRGSASSSLLSSPHPQ